MVDLSIFLVEPAGHFVLLLMQLANPALQHLQPAFQRLLVLLPLLLHLHAHHLARRRPKLPHMGRRSARTIGRLTHKVYAHKLARVAAHREVAGIPQGRVRFQRTLSCQER
jgi:hypothetical protein